MRDIECEVIADRQCVRWPPSIQVVSDVIVLLRSPEDRRWVMVMRDGNVLSGASLHTGLL